MAGTIREQPRPEANRSGKGPRRRTGAEAALRPSFDVPEPGHSRPGPRVSELPDQQCLHRALVGGALAQLVEPELILDAHRDSIGRVPAKLRLGEYP